MENFVGKTVASVEYPSKYARVVLTFTDGTKLLIKEVGYEGELEVRVDGTVVEGEEDGE